MSNDGDKAVVWLFMSEDLVGAMESDMSVMLEIMDA